MVYVWDREYLYFASAMEDTDGLGPRHPKPLFTTNVPDVAKTVCFGA